MLAKMHSDKRPFEINCSFDERALSINSSVLKRLLDFIICLLLLILLSPLLALVAFVVKASSSGPIIFCQPRVGYQNRVFICYKFRSMYHTEQDLTCEAQVTSGDSRVTPVGRWLRRLSIDELPQLMNVMLGEMSLVGPRPHAPATKAGTILFDAALEEYAKRHSVLPGITGLAQINGCRGPTRSVADLTERVHYDLKYISEWSIVLDLKIMVLTAARVLSAENAV